MPIAPNMSIHRMPTMVRRASIQTAVPQPWIQLLNATHAVNDSLNYRHLLSHSTVLADQLPHPDDGR